MEGTAWQSGSEGMVQGVGLRPGLETAGSGPLTLAGIGCRFGETVALQDIGMEVGPGEVLAVTGPSGAGKSTLCRVISGLEQPTAGRIALAGVDLLARPAGRRRIAFMFESYALYPHRTVLENVASPLRAPGRGMGGGDAGIRSAALSVLATMEIDHLAERMPAALSGGQKQRVALARTLVQTDARAILLDEPISHLDAKLRHRLRGEIRRRLAGGDVPSIWSTPDGLEALAVGDRVAVLIDGRIEQLADPATIWLRPSNTRVARLIGDPPMNLLNVETAADPAGLWMQFGDGLRLPVTTALPPVRAHHALVAGIHAAEVAVVGPDEPGTLPATVVAEEPFGKHAIVTLRFAGGRLRAKRRSGLGAPPVTPVAAGDRVGVRIDPDRCVLFDAASGNRLPEQPAA